MRHSSSVLFSLVSGPSDLEDLVDVVQRSAGEYYITIG